MTEPSRHSQTLSYSIASGSVPDDPYWLTFEQQVNDDAATQADVAAVVDELYDTNICTDTSTQGVEEESTANADPQTEEEIAAMQAKLFNVSKDVLKIDACKILPTGDYETVVKICCSHPNIPYVLHLSTTGGILAALGDPDLVRGLPIVKKSIRTNEVITVTLDVKSASSVVLPSPVVASGGNSVGMLMRYGNQRR